MQLHEAKALKKGDLVTYAARIPGSTSTVYEVVNVSPGWQWGMGQQVGQRIYNGGVNIQVREVVHMYTTFTESNLTGLERIDG